jgi:hypothetical protein
MIVIPTKVGTHFSTSTTTDGWVPAFAGMTIFGLNHKGFISHWLYLSAYGPSPG